MPALSKATLPCELSILTVVRTCRDEPELLNTSGVIFTDWNLLITEDEQGIDGGLQKRENTSDEIFNYIGVPSVDEFCKKIEKNGGEILIQKSPIPGIGYYAFFKDTEGNRLGIFEADESAK
ncbi:hypothetical protein LCGC14_2615220 [marine sediment metagenome]|uniref:VOC domain-containing protein n=1 Tax=marine sediment metagenome TaxID=412755 RepID=A0A0F9CXD1_9ZZZZ